MEAAPPCSPRLLPDLGFSTLFSKHAASLEFRLTGCISPPLLSPTSLTEGSLLNLSPATALRHLDIPANSSASSTLDFLITNAPPLQISCHKLSSPEMQAFKHGVLQLQPSVFVAHFSQSPLRLHDREQSSHAPTDSSISLLPTYLSSCTSPPARSHGLSVPSLHSLPFQPSLPPSP